MTADARMIFVKESGVESRVLAVPTFFVETWSRHLETRIPLRQANVGAAIRSEVFACSRHEAATANTATRDEVGRGLSQSFDPIMVRTCDEVDRLLEWVGPSRYFSAWVLIETAESE